jgi:uncharacterized protein DUF4440
MRLEGREHSAVDGAPAPSPDTLSHGPHELDELGATAWVQAYDAAWLNRDWERLEHLLAVDVEPVAPGRPSAVVGRASVIASLQAFLAHATVHEYNATDVQLRRSGAIRVVTYRWQLDWTVDRERFSQEGRDLLALRAGAEGWQLVRRIQLRT